MRIQIKTYKSEGSLVKSWQPLPKDKVALRDIIQTAVALYINQCGVEPMRIDGEKTAAYRHWSVRIGDRVIDITHDFLSFAQPADGTLCLQICVRWHTLLFGTYGRVYISNVPAAASYKTKGLTENE